MLKLDPNERATIPEIFGHPWVRGTASGCAPMDIAMAPARERCDDGEEDLDFAITYSPTKVALPGSPSFLSPVETGGSSNDDKLPSIVAKSPSRIEMFGAAVMPTSSSAMPTASGSGGGSGNALVPSGTPGTGRTRPGRIMDNPLQSKLGNVKVDKHSPRPTPMGTLVPSPKPSAAATLATGASSGPGNFKRNPSSSTNSSSSSRGRPRQGTANGSSGDKSHAERAAAHANESEKLPIAHQKATRRRSDQHGDLDNGPESNARSSGHALDSIGGTGKKITHSSQHGELTSASPAAAHD